MIKIVQSNFKHSTLDIDIQNIKVIVLVIERCRKCVELVNKLIMDNVEFGIIDIERNLDLTKAIMLLLKKNLIETPLVLEYSNGEYINWRK